MKLRSNIAVEDYLKAIFSVGEWDPEARTNAVIATRLGVSTSSVSEMVRKLVGLDLVSHEPYKGIELTRSGLSQALQMVRWHRLLETYLVRELGYPWDRVHAEAEVLEHAVSEFLIERMDAKLGHPWRDPHGDPIPTQAGVLHQPVAVPLGALEEGERAYVARVLDEDSELLRWFDEHELGLDTELSIVAQKPFSGSWSIHISTPNPRSLDLGIQAINALWVTAEPPIVPNPERPDCHYAQCRHFGDHPPFLES